MKICEKQVNCKGLIQQLQKVAKHRQVLPQSFDFGALLELQEAARRLSRQTEVRIPFPSLKSLLKIDGGCLLIMNFIEKGSVPQS